MSETSTPGTGQLHWPAEWEPHAATWLAWPHNPDTWPGCHEAALGEFVDLVRALHFHEPVRILVNDEAMEDQARRRLEAGGVQLEGTLRFHHVPTNDAWLRDSGPIGVRRGDERILLDFPFDSWGGKYPPWEADAAVPRAISALTGLPRAEAEFVLEGGSVDGNGGGVVLTTEACLLHPNRGPGRTREAMEARLARWLGARQVVWLREGIEGDDTDGHVDDVARFVAPRTVVAAVAGDPGDPNHSALAENLRRLRAVRDGRGGAYDVIPLPMPGVGRSSGTRPPASYANFYLANGVALVPIFGVDQDAAALAILGEALEGREVVGVSCRALVEGLGSIHCLTQQEIG
jgi:agmatine deiminase